MLVCQAGAPEKLVSDVISRLADAGIFWIVFARRMGQILGRARYTYDEARTLGMRIDAFDLMNALISHSYTNRYNCGN